MIHDPIVTRALVAVAIALLLCGVFAAWTASNVLKRVAALAVAMLGAIVGAAALGASSNLLMAAAAIGFAQLAVGAATAVRLQESYGEADTEEIDAADGRDDVAGPAP
jgi:multisubunit Na+/H+ antiporter MnhC subunit